MIIALVIVLPQFYFFLTSHFKIFFVSQNNIFLNYTGFQTHYKYSRNTNNAMEFDVSITEFMVCYFTWIPEIWLASIALCGYSRLLQTLKSSTQPLPSSLLEDAHLIHRRNGGQLGALPQFPAVTFFTSFSMSQLKRWCPIQG